MSLFTGSTIETIVNKGLSQLFNRQTLANTAEDGQIIITGKSDSITLPVQPPSYSVSVSNNNSVINIQSIGDINMIGKTGLQKISFSTFLPGIDYEFAKAVDTADYIKRLNAIRNDDTNCHLTIVGTSVDLDVTIDSFNYEDSSPVGDIDISLSFTEYKHIGENTKQIDKKTDLNQRKITALDKVKANLVYRKGDTPLTFLNRAISKTNSRGLDVNQTKYLSYAKSLIKTASEKKISFNPGDLINIRKNNNNTLSAIVNDKEFTLKESTTKFNSPPKVRS
jgi:hypothetical protein|nr:MAG TPA: tail assembly protein [Caudoviricetes sp.]